MTNTKTSAPKAEIRELDVTALEQASGGAVPLGAVAAFCFAIGWKIGMSLAGN